MVIIAKFSKWQAGTLARITWTDLYLLQLEIWLVCNTCKAIDSSYWCFVYSMSGNIIF